MARNIENQRRHRGIYQRRQLMAAASACGEIISGSMAA